MRERERVADYRTVGLVDEILSLSLWLLLLLLLYILLNYKLERDETPGNVETGEERRIN